MLILVVLVFAAIGTTPEARRTLTISDDFEYDVSRTDANAVETFQAAGWSGAKTEGDGEPAANGWLYTVTSAQIEGGCSTLPTTGTRALMIEAKPDTEGGQTDFYLQLGNGASSAFDGTIPANLWLQFWVCTPDSGSMQSNRLTRNKFFYVCNGSYGCSTHLWMLSEVACNYVPGYAEAACSANSPTPEFFWMIGSASGVSTMTWAASGVNPDVNDQWGQNQSADPVPVNAWRLVKMNIDTSGATGHVRMWMAAPEGAFTLVMDHQHGVDDITFTYPSPGGHREVRMPTTVGHASDPTQSYDYWMLLDDFTVADSEGDLPTYQSEPSSPVRLRIRGADAPQ